LILVVSLALLGLVALAQPDEQNQYTSCNGVMTSGYFQEVYDLSSINGAIKNATSGSTLYAASICANSLSCGTSCSGGAGYCSFPSSGQSTCYGTFQNAVPQTDGSGVVLSYGGGDGGNSATVTVKCSATSGVKVDGSGNMVIMSPIACNMAIPGKHNVSLCKGTLTAPNGVAYQLSAIAGKVYSINDKKGASYNISICDNDYDSCGCCAPAGFCQMSPGAYCGSTQCIGKFVKVAPRSDGSGLDLYYGGGEYGNSGQVALNCAQTLNVSITNQESFQHMNMTLTIATPSACPTSGPVPQPPQPPGPATPQPPGGCTGLGSCTSCVSSSSCEFCLNTNGCTDAGDPTCPNSIRNPALCKKVDPCEGAITCTTCTDLNPKFGCFWCPGGGSKSATCMDASGMCSSGKITDPDWCIDSDFKN